MLMQRFYTLWRTQGMTPVMALRNAQQWLRTATKRDRAAYVNRHIPTPCRQILSAVTLFGVIASSFLDRMRRRPRKGPFEHPYWWAAFYITGV